MKLARASCSVLCMQSSLFFVSLGRRVRGAWCVVRGAWCVVVVGVKIAEAKIMVGDV